jgi:hypothetical protein
MNIWHRKFQQKRFRLINTVSQKAQYFVILQHTEIIPFKNFKFKNETVHVLWNNLLFNNNETNNSVYIEHLFTTVLAIHHPVLYEGYSESNLQQAVNKTSNEKKKIIIYKKYVHTLATSQHSHRPNWGTYRI